MQITEKVSRMAQFEYRKYLVLHKRYKKLKLAMETMTLSPALLTEMDEDYHREMAKVLQDFKDVWHK